MFTVLLRASIYNGYAMYKSIRARSKALIPLREFKCRVAKDLDAPKLAKQAKNIPAKLRGVNDTVIHNSAVSTHMLLR